MTNVLVNPKVQQNKQIFKNNRITQQTRLKLVAMLHETIKYNRKKKIKRPPPSSAHTGCPKPAY